MCAPYNMTVCKQYLGNQRVFFNLTYPYGAQHNENAVLGLWEEMITSLVTSCRVPAEKLLCRYAFPDCEMTDSGPQAKPLCR